MTPHLPEAYWNDVNRYCGEILAGADAKRVSTFVLGATSQEARWEAETPNTTAILERSVIFYMGGLLREGTRHFLSFKEPTAGTDTMIEHKIIFYPDKEKISSVDTGLEFKLPVLKDNLRLRDVPGAWKNLFKYMGDRNRDWKEKKSHGLHLPGQDDYDRLHSELKRGASGAHIIR